MLNTEGKFLFTLLQNFRKIIVWILKLPLIFHQKHNSAKILKYNFEVDQFLLHTEYQPNSRAIGVIWNFILPILDPIISLSCIISFITFGYLFNLFNRKKIKVMGKIRLYHQDERIKSILECLTGLN